MKRRPIDGSHRRTAEHQGRLFDREAAKAASRRAQEAVFNATPSDIKGQILDAIKVCAMHLQTFTTDDVWLRLDALSGSDRFEARVVGPMMNVGAKLGWMEATKQWTESARVACHHRPVRVWRSLL